MRSYIIDLITVNPEHYEKLKLRINGAHIDKDQLEYFLMKNFNPSLIIKSMYHLPSSARHRLATNSIMHYLNRELSRIKENLLYFKIGLRFS